MDFEAGSQKSVASNIDDEEDMQMRGKYASEKERRKIVAEKIKELTEQRKRSTAQNIRDKVLAKLKFVISVDQ